MMDVLATQDDKFILWLVKQTPPGSTLSEALVAIATDQFNEEQDDNTISSK